MPTDHPFGILNLSHCDLPFDLAQGGELVEPFAICDLQFVIFLLLTPEHRHLKPSLSDTMLSEKRP
jgi:hypothetical protein